MSKDIPQDGPVQWGWIIPASIIKIIPVTLHQWVERIVGPALLILAIVPWIGEGQNARVFFAAVGVLILSVERLTNYRSTTAAK